MVPIHHLVLLAPSTLYKPQEISHSWITPQVIPHTWESSSQRYTNNWSHKILIQKLETQMIQEN